jgi:16S rRNA processing protein RimM
MISPDTWVPLAEVLRPHGVKGELRLKPFNKDSELLLALDDVLVRLKTGEEHEVSVDAARRADAAILMKLYSVDDRDKADDLRGALVCARRGEFPPPEPGEFYACDVLGARVLLRDPAPDRPPSEIGTVRELKSFPTADVLVVRAHDGGHDWEVPLVDSFVEGVDVTAGEVMLRTMDGLER